MVGRESVTAERILDEMREGGSVRRMRELASWADLDILVDGSLRERTRRVGAMYVESGGFEWSEQGGEGQC